MKLALALLLSLSSAAFASNSTEKTKKTLLDIETHVGKANLACDYDFFGKVEAEEFFFTDPSGKVTTREKDLAGEKGCKKHEGTYILAEPRVLIYGTTAVVSAIGTYETTDPAGVAVKHSSR